MCVDRVRMVDLLDPCAAKVSSGGDITQRTNSAGVSKSRATPTESGWFKSMGPQTNGKNTAHLQNLIHLRPLSF